MKRIKLLEKNLINQIAAGEVIERPSSIVKELVENSIDAGAGKIEIEIANDCRDIRVADNGSGIHKDDALLAFTRHATSKILSQNDLWSISTMGFRGEALASIISVAKVSCLTRTRDSQSGIRIDCKNSDVKISDTGCAVGTIMEVNDLFFNVPARAKFLKTTQTEFSSIAEIVQNIAIANPNVSFNLIHKGHNSLKTTGSGDLTTVVSEIYSKELIRELVTIHREDPEFQLEIKGFASNPDFTRSNKKAIYVFVNGRMVKCPVIAKAIDNAYKDMIPSGKYPFVVLDLSISPSEIDVNVHPSKREIRYTRANQVFNFVYASIRASLESKYVFNSPNHHKIEDYSAAYKPSLQSKSSFSSSFTNRPKLPTRDVVEKSIEFYAPTAQARIEFVKEAEIPMSKPKIIGQLDNTYILIETDEGLQLVDQHIAHERTIYDKLKKSKECAVQLLLLSENIRIEPEHLALLEEKREILSKFGYEFDKINDNEIVLTQVPQILVSKNPSEMINDLIHSVEGNMESIEDEILIMTSCHAAVKAGEKLSIWQMEELITNWQNTEYPKTCPHGRIISKILLSKEIAGFFGRNI